MAKTQADAYANYTCADFRHTYNGLDCLSKRWLAAAERDAARPGECAYAHQQADMYARMRDACQTAYDRVRKLGVDGAELDHTLVRPNLECFFCLLIVLAVTPGVPQEARR